MLRYIRGMETEPKDQRVPVMMSASEVKAVDAWRRSQESLPSRSEAVRRLVDLGLKFDSEAMSISVFLARIRQHDGALADVITDMLQRDPPSRRTFAEP
jgi:hypothetical protein